MYITYIIYIYNIKHVDKCTETGQSPSQIHTMEIWSNLNPGLAIFISRSWDLRPAAGLSSIGHLGEVAVAPKNF